LVATRTHKRRNGARPRKRGSAHTNSSPARNAAGKELVIVESPAKARTLANFLGSDYVVETSIGHVRDLPESKLGVDIEDEFAPTYVVPPEKRKVISHIKSQAKDAKAIWLATDPDREGEAISWHLVEAADLSRRPHQRLVFHEITRDAVRHAFDDPRPVNMPLVEAQQARRVLDRLIGYKISPILGQKVRRGLSAGRVQSPALKMIVDREREIEAFVPQEYWTLEADLTATSNGNSEDAFRAKFEGIAGDKLQKVELNSGAATEELMTRLKAARYRVSDIRQRTQARRPSAPFTTSTLQQDAARKLGFTARRTMALAQQLYEGVTTNEGSVGLITYMRTDSTVVSEEARDESRRYIRGRFGLDYVPPVARTFSKKAKYAQEAHEAVRPTSTRRDPESVRRFLDDGQYRLYRLIWNRFVASQMADARYDVTTVDIEAIPAAGGDNYLFRANSRKLRFTGWLELYGGRPDDEDEEGQTGAIPDLVHGQALHLVDLLPTQHFTEPPPRFTEASLVKALEENGLGRPSTYATILSTIQDREYVERVDRALKPTELGFTVNDLLQEHFADLLAIPFTAEMEEELDEVARGERQWVPVVKEFYDPLEAALGKARQADVVTEETDEVCEKSGHPMIVRWGRFGKFLACTGYPECKNTKPLEEEPQLENDEFCQECGAPMTLKRGRYGMFLACTRYPDCKGTRPFLKKLEGVRCPKDGGEIAEKSARKGRHKVFWGCVNYPDCDWSSWSMPLSQPCPQCGKLIVASGQKTAKCAGEPSCGWKGDVPDSEAATEPELVSA
jgi:DNA topoisomerase I